MLGGPSLNTLSMPLRGAAVQGEVTVGLGWQVEQGAMISDQFSSARLRASVPS